MMVFQNAVLSFSGGIFFSLLPAMCKKVVEVANQITDKNASLSGTAACANDRFVIVCAPNN